MIGYCCINTTLESQGIRVNRGMVKKTFLERGLSYAAELALLNFLDIEKILIWNLQNNIMVYRISSDSFPWMSEYQIEQLPNFEKIAAQLNKIGNIIKQNGIRVSYHPGPFNVLSSPREEVVRKTIKELNQHSQIFDLMGLDNSPLYPINIHIGNTKPSIQESAKKFCQSFDLLSPKTQRRLTVENDDSSNQFSVQELYQLIYKNIQIPIVFDQHHHNLGKQDLSLMDALNLSLSTWGNIKPLTHRSSSKKIEDSKSVAKAHADYIYEPIIQGFIEFDTEIEAKKKELAVLKYFKDFQNLLTT